MSNVVACSCGAVAKVADDAYDDAGRLASDTVAGTATTYTYDKNNRLTGKNVGSTANSYGYDQAGRLTSWTSPTGVVAYKWDAAGNRTKAGDRQATCDERNRVLTEGTNSYTHSARGSLLSKSGGETFAFDAFDRMTRQGGQNYSYDSLDRVNVRNGRSFTYGGLSNELVSDGESTFSRGAADQLLAVSKGGVERLAVSDRRGDVVGTLDPAGPMTSLADSTTFDPFGQVVASTGTKHSLGYQGDWTDLDSGQVNMSARWYNPGSGGFVSRDSYTLPAIPSGMGNRYTYGLGAPTNHTDPTGHTPDDWCLCPPRPAVEERYEGDWICLLLPVLCAPPSEDPPPSPTRPDGKVPSSRHSQVDGGSDPADTAREKAREFGRNNPLPVPQALTQPLYGNDRTPPVSSSPQVRSHLAGDYANPVDDVNNSYAAVYAQLVEQNGSIVQNVSASLSSPTWLTEEPNSDTSWETELMEQCFTLDQGLPVELFPGCFDAHMRDKLTVTPEENAHLRGCDSVLTCLWLGSKEAGGFFFGLTTASDVMERYNTRDWLSCVSGALGPGWSAGSVGRQVP
ncbi:RHS repeat-associated core domain-containing protein [Actinosynnema sp. CA-248983]